MNNQKLWTQILNDFQTHFSLAIYKTWFRELRFKEIQEHILIIACPNVYTKETLERKLYLPTVYDICKKYFPEVKEIVLEVKKGKELDSPTGPLFGNETKPEFETSEHRLLNQTYNFENFVIGQSNNLAVAAAQAIVENPGLAYNPFFIYGGVGLGKTHLICAIGNEILNKDPNKKVLYISSEKFTNELILSIQKNQTQVFRNKHRQADVLIIDDIQFIAGKEASQEEFFHTFNTLYSANKQIILTSDKPPREINKLEERLVSRFEGGLTVDIQPPDYETRVAILREKCLLKKIDLSPEVINYIAEVVTENIRKLEGILSQVMTYTMFNKKELTLDEVKRLLGNREVVKNRKLTPDLIINTVSEFYGIKEKDIKGKSRKAEFVRPRQTIMYLLKKELDIPLMQIGRFLGDRDHTTVIHAIDKTELAIKNQNSDIYTEVTTIKKLILS